MVGSTFLPGRGMESIERMNEMLIESKSEEKSITVRPGITPGRIWLEIETGEGGDFPEEMAFSALRKLYEEHS